MIFDNNTPSTTKPTKTLSLEQKNQALLKLQQKQSSSSDLAHLTESFYQIDKLPYYKVIAMMKSIGERTKIQSPYFLTFDSVPSNTISHQGQSFINFATYNYLDLCGHPQVNTASKAAIDQYGTSSASSRIVCGERDIHQHLEQAIAKLYGTEDAVAFVSGHATNVTAIGHLFNNYDLILYDNLSHNSLVQGALLSGAKRKSFPHNDLSALENLLQQHRHKYERVLIVVEGLYSMDGDVAPVPGLIKLKQKYKSFLMVDEAHSIGVLGEQGLGIREYFDIDVGDVDIWMGTLSKTFAGCGGYITGHKNLVEYLRYTAPGFLYSVGMSPPLAAASITAISLLLSEPERVQQLQSISQYFLQQANNQGFDTGPSIGYGIIPIYVGDSVKTVEISNALFSQGITTQPVTYPAVPERMARLRFFMNSSHTTQQVDTTMKILTQIMQGK